MHVQQNIKKSWLFGKEIPTIRTNLLLLTSG